MGQGGGVVGDFHVGDEFGQYHFLTKPLQLTVNSSLSANYILGG